MKRVSQIQVLKFSRGLSAFGMAKGFPRSVNVRHGLPAGQFRGAILRRGDL